MHDAARLRLVPARLPQPPIASGHASRCCCPFITSPHSLCTLQLRRYLERRLQDAAAAAADPGGGGKAKGRPRKPPPGLQPPSQPAATAAVAALHSLARAPLAELATAATRLGEQGALPQQTVKRVKDLVGRLAAKDCDSPRGAAGSGARPRLRSGRMFCFPPPEGLPAAAPPPPSRPAGLGSGPGLSQRGKQGQQAKQAEVLCELPTADALTAYLHASYLGEAPAARVAAEPAVSVRRTSVVALAEMPQGPQSLALSKLVFSPSYALRLLPYFYSPAAFCAPGMAYTTSPCSRFCSLCRPRPA